MLKTEVIRAKATPIERQALEALAARESLKTSEMLRQLVRTAAKTAGVWPETNVDFTANRNAETNDAER